MQPRNDTGTRRGRTCNVYDDAVDVRGMLEFVQHFEILGVQDAREMILPCGGEHLAVGRRGHPPDASPMDVLPGVNLVFRGDFPHPNATVSSGGKETFSVVGALQHLDIPGKFCLIGLVPRLGVSYDARNWLIRAAV
jgi:hypothetical protein